MKKLNGLAVCLCLLAAFAFGGCRSKGNDKEVASHQHEFETAWTADKDGHWHASNCGHTAVTSGYAVHEYDGENDEFCNICNYQRNVSSVGGEEQPKDPDNGEEEKPNPPEEPKDPDNSEEEKPNQAEEPKDPDNVEEKPNPPEEPQDPDNGEEETPNPPEEPKDPDNGEEEPNPPEEPKDPDNGEEEKPNPPEQPEEPDDPKVDGFVIDADITELDISGVETEYTLSNEQACLDIGNIALTVWLCRDSERTGEVPKENYTIKVYYLDEELSDYTALTAEGEYKIEVALTGAKYKDGTDVQDKIVGESTFVLKNPFVAIRLKSGKVVQYASATDKISSSWKFESIRANGDTQDIDGAVTFKDNLVTAECGKYGVEVEWNGISGIVEYEIKPIPEIVSSVEVALSDATATETEEDAIVLTANDFVVQVVATGKYAQDIKLNCDGNLMDEVTVAADGETHSVTVVVIVQYEVEGEAVTRTYSKIVEVTVTKKVTLPDPGDETVLKDLLVDNTVIAQPESGDWNDANLNLTFVSDSFGNKIELKGQDDCSVTKGSEDFQSNIVITPDFDGVFYEGLVITLSKSAKVTICGSFSQAIAVFINEDYRELYFDENLSESEIVIDLEVNEEQSTEFVFRFIIAENITISSIAVNFVSE